MRTVCRGLSGNTSGALLRRATACAVLLVAALCLGSAAYVLAFVNRNVVQRGLEPVFNTPEDFARRLEEQRVHVEKVAKEAGLKPQ